MYTETRMYHELADKIVKTKTAHDCEWCGQRIEAGERVPFRKYVFENEGVISAWMHPECRAAMERCNYRELAQGWEVGDFQRGSTEPA